MSKFEKKAWIFILNAFKVSLFILGHLFCVQPFKKNFIHSSHIKDEFINVKIDMLFVRNNI